MKQRLKRVSAQLRMEDDILTKSGRPVIPPSLRNFVTCKFHDSSHFGCDEMYQLLKERFYWPNMYRYIRIFISSCESCQSTKANNPPPPKAPLLPIQEPESPMEFISMDILYMPVDSEEYKFILVIGDLFSKYVEAMPLRRSDAVKGTISSINYYANVKR